MRVIRCSLPRSPEAPLASSSPDIAADSSWASRCGDVEPAACRQQEIQKVHTHHDSRCPVRSVHLASRCFPRTYRHHSSQFSTLRAFTTACLLRSPFHNQNSIMIRHNLLLLVGAAAATFSNMNIRCSAFLSGTSTRPVGKPVRAVEIDGRRRVIHSSHPHGRPSSHQTLRGERYTYIEEF